METIVTSTLEKEGLLVLHCGGPHMGHKASVVRKCNHSIHVPFGISKNDLIHSLAAHGWIVSVVTTAEIPDPASDVLCARCAKLYYTDRLYYAALARVREKTIASPTAPESASPLLCEHANEVPRGPCPCDPDCYCQQNTCKQTDQVPVETKTE